MRTIVVGSGLAGLLVSAALARAGVHVVRVDRSADAGGRARSPLVGAHGGRAHVPMNLGPRAISRGGPFMSALRSFGVEPRGFVPPSRGISLLLGGASDGEVAALPSSLGDLLGASLLDGRDKRALAMALARITVGALDVDDGMSIGTWLDVHGGPPRARAMLAMLIRVATYSHDPAHDAGLALRQVRRALTRGVLYVDGGWQSIVDALARDAGAHTQRDVHTLSDVSSLVDNDGDRVVLALPAAETRAIVAGLPEVPAPITASCLDLVLTSLPDPKRRVCFGLDAPLYFSVHTAPDAPPDAPIKLHVMANGAATRAELESFVDLVQPGWRERLVDDASARYLSRMIVCSALPRAGTARTPLTLDGRTFFAGDHVDSGELLADAAAQSAADVARAIVHSSVQTESSRAA